MQRCRRLNPIGLLFLLSGVFLYASQAYAVLYVADGSLANGTGQSVSTWFNNCADYTHCRHRHHVYR